MKRVFLALGLLGLFCLLGAVGSPAAAADYRVVVASDPHYIAPTLADGGSYYQRVLQNGDCKFMPYSEEILSAFVDEVIAERPDALLLTGDLTFNGAVISHEALIEKLRRIEDAGVPVLVLTGNHDVYNTNAARFHGDSFTRIPSATTELFASLYADFGLREALAVDDDSLSYVYPLNASTRVLMLDLNTAHDFCGVSEQTLAWVERQLKDARDAGVSVLAAGHQNLFQHSIFRGGYVISRAEKLAELLRAYKVPLYLSGHLHIQHIQEEDGLTEIATSALCSYPCQYGVLTAGGGEIRYAARRLDMAAWAARSGRDEPVFQDFAAAAGDYMDAHFSGTDMLPLSSDPEDWAAMLRYLRALNRSYFGGDLTGLDALDPDGSLAERWLAPGDLTALYVASVLRDAGQDFTSAVSLFPESNKSRYPPHRAEDTGFLLCTETAQPWP